jgi:hypothetical protein
MVALLATAACAADVDHYVPDDVGLIVQVNVRKALEAPLTKKYALEQLHDALHKHADVQGALDALEIDPFRDLHSVTIAGTPSDGQFKGVAIVRGRFDPAKVRAAAEQFAREHSDELKLHQHDGVVVYEAIKREPKEQTVFAALLDREVLILATTRKGIHDAIALRDGKKTPTLSRDLKALVDRIDGEQTVWLAGVVMEEMKKELARSLLGKEKAGQVKSFAGGVQLDDTILAEFQIQTTSAQTASDLRKMLDGLKALTAFAVANNKKIPGYGPLLSDVLHALKISSDRAGTVTVRARITPAQIDKGLRKGQKP